VALPLPYPCPHTTHAASARDPAHPPRCVIQPSSHNSSRPPGQRTCACSTYIHTWSHTPHARVLSLQLCAGTEHIIRGSPRCHSVPGGLRSCLARLSSGCEYVGATLVRITNGSAQPAGGGPACDFLHNLQLVRHRWTGSLITGGETPISCNDVRGSI